MTLRAGLAALATVVALGAAGCGEDEPQSDRDRVRGVVERFNDAFAGGDYGAACEELHSRRREQLEQGRGQSCEDILANAAESDTSLVQALSDARITTIMLQGDLAIIGVEGPSIGAGQAMVERDGERGWRLSESAAGL